MTRLSSCKSWPYTIVDIQCQIQERIHAIQALATQVMPKALDTVRMPSLSWYGEQVSSSQLKQIKLRIALDQSMGTGLLLAGLR